MQKLSNNAVEAMAAYNTIKKKVKQVRKRQRDEDDTKLAKRVKKNKDQRVWAIEEIIEQNARMDDPIGVRKLRKNRKLYIIAIKVPWEAL
jgi:hypothetical protein